MTTSDATAVVIGPTHSWGPYRSSVEERLASCEDYLGRLRRSLDGVIAPDRHYFDSKAHELRDAAQSLVDYVDDVDWWLGACREEIELPALGGEVSISDCGLAVGHEGRHVAEEQCAELRALADVRALSRSFTRVADRLAWGLLTIRAGAGVTSPNELSAELRKLERGFAAVVASVEALPARAATVSEEC